MYKMNIKWKYRQNFGLLLAALGLGIVLQLPTVAFTYRYTFQEAIPKEYMGILLLLIAVSTIIIGLSIASLAETRSQGREIAITDTLTASWIIGLVYNIGFLGIYPLIQELDFIDPKFKQFPPEVAFFVDYALGITLVLAFFWIYTWFRNYLSRL